LNIIARCALHAFDDWDGKIPTVPPGCPRRLECVCVCVVCPLHRGLSGIIGESAARGQPAGDVRGIGYRPTRTWREAPRAKRALWKILEISMPSVSLVSSYIVLSLSLLGLGARFAQWFAALGALRAHGSLLVGALRAQP
jgi:hypothetical protein